MDADLGDLTAFLAVAKARGFREAARTSGTSAPTLSEAVRRLKTRLGMRLLHRSTRSFTPPRYVIRTPIENSLPESAYLSRFD